MKGILVDANYENGKIRLTIKEIESQKLESIEFDYDDYFLVEKNEENYEKIKNEKIPFEEVRKKCGGIERSFFKISKNFINFFNNFFEADIPPWKKFLIEKDISPMNLIEIKNGEMKNISEVIPELNFLAFDIETYAPFIIPRSEKDPIIFASFYSKEKKGVITYKNGNRDFQILVKDEAELIKKLSEILNESEVVIGYNSSSFDIPYLMKRARKNNYEFSIGKEMKIKKLTSGKIVRTTGTIHFDLFYLIRLLVNAQAIKTHRFSLEEIYEEVAGKKKIDIDEEKMCEIYDNESLRGIYLDYSLSDALATYEIFLILYPLIAEISRITKIPIGELNNVTSSELVESLLFESSSKNNFLIPNRPIEEEIYERIDEKVLGAYVKIPEPGIYDNIVVCDFRSLYPSIIVSHNIDPYTLNCGHEECKKNISPAGHYFCTKKIGLIPMTVKNLLKMRKDLKERLKKVSEGKENIQLKAKVAALKIILNSFYGMFRYVRSRWYSRECAESITTFGRKYILEIADLFEKEGFEVIYMDTDSVFLLLGEKKFEDVTKIVEKINKSLPEDMELEIENLYTRGVFVEKKSEEEKGAKKKYALIDKEGRIKIRGFELVRRDWCKLARDIQKEVLETILKEGDKEKVLKIVREKISQLKEGKVNKEDLIIYTQLRKGKYKVTSPEFSAYEKARKRGVKIPIGSIIGYIITKNGKSISEKAELSLFAKDYDVDYYINNQIIPAVLKILGSLGYKEEDIKFRGKQSSLGEF